MNNDYGMKLKANGLSTKQDVYFYEIPLVDFFKLDNNSFTFMVSEWYQNQELVLSFDFSNRELKKIHSIIETQQRICIKDPFYPNKCIINQAIYLDIKARLGKEEQDSSGDKFIPFIIKEIS